MTPWRSRLVAYQLGTDVRLGLLPDALSYEASLCRNDAGALKLTYSRKAVNGAILDTPLRDGLDIALEVNWAGGDNWVEPPGGRYPWVDVKDDAADQTDTAELVLPSYGWLLGKIGNNALEMMETSGPDAGNRLFTPGRPGLMRILLDEWASRHPGKLLRLAWNFTATHDSTGAAWAKVKDSIPYAVHTPLSTIMASLASMDGGLCDWETVGRTLALYNPDSRVADLSSTVRLEIGRDIMSAPSQETLADSAGWIMVRGEGNVVGVYTDAESPAQIAAWEATLQVSGATTEAEALAAAAGELEHRSRDRGQYTRELLLEGRAEWLPLRDYQPGDVITAQARRERRAMRVQQITLTRDGQGRHGGSVVLNDRLVPESLRQSRTLRALAQNAAIVGPGSPVSPVDTRTPKPPTTLVLSDQRYVDVVGVWHSRIGASWTPTTQATNGSLMPITRYELWGQPVVGGVDQQWRSLTDVDGSAATAAHQPFEIGQQWRFAVVAVGANGQRSGRSIPQLWTFGNDTTPPGKPAASTANPYLGAVVVRWTGLLAAGGAQPGDFARGEVHISTNADFTPDPATTLRGSIMPGGTLTVSGLTYDTVHYIKIVTVDTSGNRSTPSDATPITPRRAENEDFSVGTLYTIRNVAGPIDGNHTRMEPDGFSAWMPNPKNGDAIEKFLRLGDAGLSWGFEEDAPQAAISPDGLASFQQVSVGQLIVGGDTLTEILDPLPKGVIARTEGFANVTGITGTAVALSELRVLLQPGRLYRIGVDTLPISVTAGATRSEIKLHQTDDGSPVTTASPAWIWRSDVITTTGVYIAQPTFTRVLDTSGWSDPKEYRFLLSAARAAGAGSISVWGSDCQIVVQDLGAAIAPTTTQVRQTRVWDATAMYQGGAGSPVTEAWVGQGNWIHALFGSSVAAAMSGATVHAAAVYCYLKTGRIASFRGVSSNAATANPTAPSGGSYSRMVTPGSGMWVALPDWTTAMQSVKVHGGVGVVANDADHRVQLRIDYTK